MVTYRATAHARRTAAKITRNLWYAGIEWDRESRPIWTNLAMCMAAHPVEIHNPQYFLDEARLQLRHWCNMNGRDYKELSA